MGTLHDVRVSLDPILVPRDCFQVEFELETPTLLGSQPFLVVSQPSVVVSQTCFLSRPLLVSQNDTSSMYITNLLHMASCSYVRNSSMLQALWMSRAWLFRESPLFRKVGRLHDGLRFRELSWCFATLICLVKVDGSSVGFAKFCDVTTTS